MKEEIPKEITSQDTETMTYRGKPTNIYKLGVELHLKHGTIKELEKDFKNNVNVPRYTTKEKVLQEIKRQNRTLL